MTGAREALVRHRGHTEIVSSRAYGPWPELPATWETEAGGA